MIAQVIAEYRRIVALDVGSDSNRNTIKLSVTPYLFDGWRCVNGVISDFAVRIFLTLRVADFGLRGASLSIWDLGMRILD